MFESIPFVMMNSTFHGDYTKSTQLAADESATVADRRGTRKMWDVFVVDRFDHELEVVQIFDGAGITPNGNEFNTVDPMTVQYLLNDVTTGMVIDGLGGDDLLTINVDDGFVSGGIVFHGGNQVTMGDTVVKGMARKVRALKDGTILAGFAGAVADAFTLFEKLEEKLQALGGKQLAGGLEFFKTRG